MAEQYQPPKKSWRLPVLIETPLEKLKETVVDCPECPVYLFCKEGQGGTGWWCAQCGMTGVWIDEPDPNELPKDLLNIDCAKHNFEKHEKRKHPICSFCSGGIMQLEYLNTTEAEDRMRNHLVLTVHSKVTVEERQKVLKRDFARWKEHYEKKRK